MTRLPEKSFKEEKEMLDIKLITENPELVKERLAKKGCIVDFTEILKLDAARKKLMSEIEALKAEKNFPTCPTTTFFPAKRKTIK